MKKEYVFRILWVLFGILLFKALDSVITSIVYFTFHYLLENNYTFNTKIKGFIFGVTILSYLSVTIFLIIFITKKLKRKGLILKENIPKITFLILLIIAISLKPLTLYISDLKIKNTLDDLTKFDYISSIDFSSLDKFINTTIYTCKWSAFAFFTISLFILSYRLMKREV